MTQNTTDDATEDGIKTFELPTGETVEKLWRCADCGHISAECETEWQGARKLQRCEECGNRSLMTHPGDVVEGN